MTWTVTIENIAGIRRGSATLEPGLNAVRGTNWQGKSSFIRSLKTGLGTDRSLTEGEDRGRVELAMGDDAISVGVERDGTRIATDGTPYLTNEYDVARAELYACLDEANPVRRAVQNGDNLEDVLTRPLDFQNIDQQIAELKREREQVKTELAQAEEAKKRLPSVQERVTQLEADIEEKRDALEVTAGADDGDQTDARDRLSQTRAEHDQLTSRIERYERSIERLEEALAEKRAELESLDSPADADVEEELAAARDELTAVRKDVEIVQSLYSANKRILREDRLDLLTDVDRGLVSDDLTCWVCDGDVTRETLEARVEEMSEKVSSLRAEVETRRDRVEELEARREQVTQAERRRTDLEDEIADHERTLSERRESLADARDRHETLEATIEELAEQVEETAATVTDIESEIKYREAELEEARDELETLESRAAKLEARENDREQLTEEIEELRNRKDRIKHRAREAFDEAMDDVLARFDTGFETARLTADFDLVVARRGREANLDALSEGELELLGFVAALAGYESFDVAEAVPLLLVDGVGSLADDNLRTLVEYLRERAEYLVFTVHPEYGDFDAHEIAPTDWDIVHDEDWEANA